MRRVAAVFAALAAVAGAGCELAQEQCSNEQVCSEPAARFGVGGGTGSAAVRDLDGDGAPEWVAVDPKLGTLTIAWGYSGAAQTWSIGQVPVDLVFGDVDGDGRLDVAAPLAGEGALALLRGAGRGRLGAVERVPVGPRPVAAAAADLDGDGRVEVIVADEQTGDLRVVRAGPDGLVVGAPMAAGDGPTSLAAGDFSGDGRVDVAVTLAVEGAARLFLGTGEGRLRPGPALYVGAGPRRALAADVDDDGALDLALVDDLLDEAALVLGDGAGGARETRRWSVPAGPAELALRTGPEGHELLVLSNMQRALTRVPLAAPERRTASVAEQYRGLAVGDIDGDGADEVVVGHPGGAVALRDAPGFGFSPWVDVDDPGLAGPLAAGDVDRDGWLDLVVSDVEHGEIALLRGQAGGFAAPVRSPGPKDAEALALADLDGDGASDVLTWRRASYMTYAELRAGLLWSARGVGERFESPVEFEFAGDPRRVIAFDGDGDGRSELLALQARFYAMDGRELGEDAGFGLLTLQLEAQAFALVDAAMSDEFAVVDDVLAGDFSGEYAGDELIRVAVTEEGPVILVESRSAGRTWIGGTLPAALSPRGLTRADFTGDGIADLLLCNRDSLLLAAGLAWNEFAPAQPLSDAGCDAAVVAELDGDGRADALALQTAVGEPTVAVRLGHALPWLPHLLPGGTTTASNRPQALAIADFDGDGRPDLAASGLDGLQVLRGGPQVVLRADPDGAMRAAVARGLQLGDVDGDGREEVVAFGRNGDVGIGRFDATGSLGPVRYDMSEMADDLRGAAIQEHKKLLDVDGDGVDELLWAFVWPARGIYFTELQRVVAGRFVRAAGLAQQIASAGPVLAGDLDGDGDDDLVYVHEAGVLVTHLGGPDGPGPALPGPWVVASGFGLQLGDVDRDGRLDAMVSTWGDGVFVHAGDGRGGFAGEPQMWPTGFISSALVTGDLDGDGFGDLVAGAGYSGAGQLRVCHGGADGPRGACRDVEIGGEDAEVSALAVEDIDADGVTDVLAVLVESEARTLVFARGGDGRLVPHSKPLPPGGMEPSLGQHGELRRLTLDDGGPEWVYVDDVEVTRLGVRAR